MQYFNARNINPHFYENHKLPKHLKDILMQLEHKSHILDFGCGFGQKHALDYRAKPSIPKRIFS